MLQHPGDPRGPGRKMERKGDDGGCLPGTYPAQNDTENKKVAKFER